MSVAQMAENILSWYFCVVRACVCATVMCIRQICFESNRPRQNNSAANTFVYLHIEFMEVFVFIYSFGYCEFNRIRETFLIRVDMVNYDPKSINDVSVEFFLEMQIH